ncbi:hypothetical protein EI555_019633 [Monodon monoceros]|uniref:G-protein coupled receptors family 1 profile domain-containing protein n=1 Tax=Monodon monoceros TaxID=40151 RepID=A0A4U1FG64_MONMO|nr:hypothetical protein EI555_019633 [Monodon monoceros]
MYLVGAAGNLLIILAIGSDSHLHMPKDFFLSDLSLVDFCFISATVPKMLVNIQTQTQSISYGCCLAQIYFCILLVNMDNFLLMAMAYDLYTATCQPLHYSMVMSMPVCALMLGSSWPLANFHSLLPTLLMARLEFCASNVIPYSFCDLAPLIQLSCPNTQLNQLMILLEGGPGGPHPLPWHSRLLHPHCVCCATGGPEDPKYLSDDKDRDALRTEMIQEQEMCGQLLLFKE